VEAARRLAVAFKGTIVAVRRLRGRDSQRPGELSFAQCQLLFALAAHGELTTGELALAADLAPASVTQMLDALAAGGLVERIRSERDRRVVTCSLTPLGADLTAKRQADYEQRWQAQLAGFTTAELATAAAVIEHLRAMYESFDLDAARAS
jgi:DNA-binding MarR family transcriptional regulator